VTVTVYGMNLVAKKKKKKKKMYASTKSEAEQAEEIEYLIHL
jgi:hypothetical protein